MGGTAPAAPEATVTALIAIIEQPAETIKVLTAALVGSGTNGSESFVVERPRWDDPEIVAGAKTKIVKWLGDHPRQHPCKSEMARRLCEISNATVRAAISVLEAEGTFAVERTHGVHLLSLVVPSPRTPL